MRLDNMFDNGEAEAGAALLAGTAAVHPVEAFEDAFEAVGGNARALIDDADFYLLILLVGGNGHEVVAVFDGIFDQVEQNLTKALLIREDGLVGTNVIFQNDV